MFFNDDALKEKLFNLFLNKRKNVLLLGAGGTGKSYTIEQIKQILKERGANFSLLGTTGISSVNIGGQTLHRWAGTGIDMNRPFEVIMSYVESSPGAVNRWKNTDIIILDEISMLGKKYFEVLNYVGQKIRKNKNLFGGIQLLFCGDLLQLPPVNDEWIFKSKHFTGWETIQFVEPKRYPDLKYFDILKRLRVGETTQEDYDVLFKRFQKYHSMIKDFDKLDIKPTIIYSKKIDVQKINQEELEKLDGKKLSSLSRDSKIDSTNGIITVIQRSENVIDSSIPEIIEFKVGAQVILKINHDIDNGLCNGSRGVVTEINISSGEIKVKFKNQIELWFGKHEWKSTVDDKIYKREQIPFILGYAVTIHSCQGMTLDSAIVDLGYSIFLPAQAYVALSRVRTLEGLYISKISEQSFFADEDAVMYVKNLFMENIWAILENYDEKFLESYEDFLDDINKNTKIKTNDLEFIQYLTKKKVESQRVCKNIEKISEENLYKIYIEDLPTKIYIFYTEDNPHKYKSKLKNIVDKKMTKIIDWPMDI